jgi:hypothetical protein
MTYANCEQQGLRVTVFEQDKSLHVAAKTAIEIVKSKDDLGLSRDRKAALYCYLRPEERYI